MGDEQEEMTCQECGKKRATIHLTDFIDGKPVQMHLCEACYNKKDGLPPLTSAKLLAALVGTVVPELQKIANKQCPQCGISYREFWQTFRLGCPNDYEAFQESLDQLLEQIHGATRHIGKIPAGAAQKCAREARAEVLHRELQEVVKKEDFERAAWLRDEIRKLEQEGAGGTEQ